MYQVGDEIIYTKKNRQQVLCNIMSVNDNSYDILYPERNVMFESLFIPIGSELTKGNMVIYKKKNKIYEAMVTYIDHQSKSAQIRIIKRNKF